MQSLQRPVEITLSNFWKVRVHSFSDFYHFFELFVTRPYDLPDLKDPKLIVDVGANIGMFTMRAKKLYPESHVISYEPVSLNFKRLHENIIGNDIEGVELVNKGVAGESRSETIYLHPENTGGHSIFPSQVPNTSNSIDIELESIRNVLRNANAPIDLLKLDCEGAEGEIIMSLSRSHANKIRRMIIETTFGLYDKREFLSKLSELGYVYRIHNGLLVAEHAEG